MRWLALGLLLFTGCWDSSWAGGAGVGGPKHGTRAGLDQKFTANRGTTPFDPLSVSGLLGWYDFSDATTLYTTDDCSTTLVSSDGDSVECAKDKSGNNDHITQTTAANEPVYKVNIQNSLSVLRYDGTDYLQDTGWSGGSSAQANTIFVVCAVTTVGSSSRRYSNGGAARAEMVHTSSTDLYQYAGAFGTAFGVKETDWEVFGCIYNGASSACHLDGTDYTSIGNPSTGASDGLTLPCFTNGTLCVTADCGEALVYNSDLGGVAGEDFVAVKEYLEDKWDTL